MLFIKLAFLYYSTTFIYINKFILTIKLSFSKKTYATYLYEARTTGSI